LKDLTAEEKLEQALRRAQRMREWHRLHGGRHRCREAQLRRRLAKMRKQQTPQTPPVPPAVDEDDDGPLPAVEDIQLTPVEEEDARRTGEEFVKRLVLGNGADPALASANETLMPSGAVQVATERIELPAEVPEGLAGATVVKTLVEERTRYDFSLSVTRLELAVEKKVVVTDDGERQVIAASTSPYSIFNYSISSPNCATGKVPRVPSTSR
jgi:hypothetical protein